MRAGRMVFLATALIGVIVVGWWLGRVAAEETETVTKQPVSKWVVGLKAPLRNAYEETNERGQVIGLGEREISFRLTRPADSVVVEVLFRTYAVFPAASSACLRYEMTEDYPYPARWNEVWCPDKMGVPVWRQTFSEVPAESTVIATWDYVWDEELIKRFQVAPWGVEAYGGGLTKANPGKFVIVETAVPHKGRALPCDEWLPDPYHPQEIWGTWRHDERGRVVQGGYVTRVIAYSGAESRARGGPGINVFATGNSAGRESLLEQARRGLKQPFWGWYVIPTPTASNWYHLGGAETELRLMEEEKK